MLELNPQNIDALKNIYLRDNCIVTVESVECKHRDAIGKGLLDHLAKFDVNGYTMSFRFKPIVYVMITVCIDTLRKTILISELPNFKNINLNALKDCEISIKYNSDKGIPVW